MGGSNQVQIKAPPPPVAPPDEADKFVIQAGTLMATRARAAMLGYRRTFAAGPRGPGGPDWQDPEVAKPVQSPAQAGAQNSAKQSNSPGGVNWYNNLPTYKRDQVEDPEAKEGMTPAQLRAWRQSTRAGRTNNPYV